MAKNKSIEQKTEVQARIQVQEIKEEGKPVLTVKERIDKVVDKYFQDKDELKKQIFQLVQRILYPEQFCPDCDERMFFNPPTSSYNCPNCGYQSAIITSPEEVTRINRPIPGRVPEVVEKVISEADETMKDIPTSIKPTPLGEKIRKLVADRDAGGSAAPTKEDEALIKGADKNVANEINWI